MVTLAVILIIYGFLTFFIARRLPWAAIGLHAAVFLCLIFCQYFKVGYAGGSDPAGNAMESGFLHLFYYALMALFTTAFFVGFFAAVLKRR